MGEIRVISLAATSLVTPARLGAAHPSPSASFRSSTRANYDPTARTPQPQAGTFTTSSSSLSEMLFDARTNLKVAVAAYAMHLRSEDRQRTFEEIDFLLNEDGWYAEDSLPARESFVAFLKWSIFSRNWSWSSLGLSSDGDTQAAWVDCDRVMTARFTPAFVHWTFRDGAGSEQEAAAGYTRLKAFAAVADFYLGRHNADIENR